MGGTLRAQSVAGEGSSFILSLPQVAEDDMGVSYATEAPSEAQLAGLTYGTVSDADRAETRASWNQWDVAGTAVVVALILAAYLYFNG